MNTSKHTVNESAAAKENEANEHDAAGLKVIIAGAGIAGLFAAIGLRQQGHHVEIYEKSKFARETGAAVHIAPNAHGILKRLGIDVSALGANQLEQITEYDPTGKQLRTMEVASKNKMWQHEWRLAHRVRLHEALKTAATADHGRGPPVKLHLANAVTDVNPERAEVMLADGSVVQGDVILAADGVGSVCRAKVPGGDVQPASSGKSAFRFLIDKSAVYDDPTTRHFAERSGELTMWYGSDRRLVMYPTTDNTLLNFVCIHPENESVGGKDWTTATNLDALLSVYKDFDEGTLALLRKASPESLKVWNLLDMPKLPTFINGSMALLGDAAHPFLPHQGQGAGAAMEDAATLTVVLERGLDKNDVPERLKLYEQIRYERAHKVQEYSRLAGRDLIEGEAFDITGYTNYNFGHDEFDNSTQRLREWKWAKTPDVYWRMPTAFGPMSGPRQSHTGRRWDANESTFRTASIKIKTSRTVLQNLLPIGATKMRFTSPGTVAYCSFSCSTLDKMKWLGGSGYNHLGLYIHGVEYETANGEVLKGTYLPILFENLCDPIISGREELGMPKLYSSIDCTRDEGSYRVSTGWQGSLWGAFEWNDLKPVPIPTPAAGPPSSDEDIGTFLHRYVPKVGREFKGQPEAEYPVFIPFKEYDPKPVVNKIWEASEASINIDELDWDALPTLHHIVSRFKEIPVYEIVSARLVEGTGVPDIAIANRIG